MTDVELPPMPEAKTALIWELSLKALTLNDKAWIEHGIGKQPRGQERHMILFHLGAPSGSLIELRVYDGRFFSDHQFVALVKRDDDVIQVGRAVPHPDEKGYQLWLTRDIEDGEVVALRIEAIEASAAAKTPKANKHQKTKKRAPRPRYG